ncbi:MAG: hypothetical protein RKK15_13010, partial [Defluviicoccus sp.]|nr:hypothetical protein [Defluviicoccus sp.]
FMIAIMRGSESVKRGWSGDVTLECDAKRSKLTPPIRSTRSERAVLRFSQGRWRKVHLAVGVKLIAAEQRHRQNVSRRGNTAPAAAVELGE